MKSTLFVFSLALSLFAASAVAAPPSGSPPAGTRYSTCVGTTLVTWVRTATGWKLVEREVNSIWCR